MATAAGRHRIGWNVRRIRLAAAEYWPPETMSGSLAAITGTSAAAPLATRWIAEDVARDRQAADEPAAGSTEAETGGRHPRRRVEGRRRRRPAPDGSAARPAELTLLRFHRAFA